MMGRVVLELVKSRRVRLWYGDKAWLWSQRRVQRPVSLKNRSGICLFILGDI